MKVIPRMSATEFRRRLSQLTKAWRTQRTQFAKQLERLLGQISDGQQFQQVLNFCLSAGTGPAFMRTVVHAWDVAMELHLYVVELRKRLIASFDWLIANAREYAAVYKQCAPGAPVALRIKRLFEAAGYPMPA